MKAADQGPATFRHWPPLPSWMAQQVGSRCSKSEYRRQSHSLAGTSSQVPAVPRAPQMLITEVVAMLSIVSPEPFRHASLPFMSRRSAPVKEAGTTGDNQGSDDAGQRVNQQPAECTS